MPQEPQRRGDKEAFIRSSTIMKTTSVFNKASKFHGNKLSVPTHNVNKPTNNLIAAKRIRDLCRQIGTRKNDKKLISDALQIYGQIREKPNYLPINALLDLMTATNQYHPVNELWNNIQTLLHRKDRQISLNALIECLCASQESAKCIEVLKVMENQQLTSSELSDSVLIQLIKASNLNELCFIKQWRIRTLSLNEVELSLMRALVECHGNTEAVELYDAMRSHPKWEETSDRVIGICSNLAIKACSNGSFYEKGIEIHDALRMRNQLNFQMKHSLIMFYGKYRRMDRVVDILESIPESDRDAVTLNVMMTAYSSNDQYQSALDVYQSSVIPKNERSHVLAIRACQQCNDYDAGKVIHEEIERNDSRHSMQLQHSLMAFYGHFGDIKSAETAFQSIARDQMDKLSVCTMIRLYADHNGKAQRFDRQILALYDAYSRFVDDDDLVHLLALKCCSNLGDLQRAHCIMTQRILDPDRSTVPLRNKMIEIYGALHRVGAAKDIFESMDNDEKTQSTINSMMTVFVENRYYGSAFALYDEYGAVHEDRDRLHNLALKTAIATKDTLRGREIADKLVAEDRVSRNVQISNSLIKWHGFCGDIESAEAVFEGIEGVDGEKKDIVTVNAMMDILIDNSRCKRALRVYNEHSDNGTVKAGTHWVTHMLALKACGEIKAIDLGMDIIANRISESDRLRNTQIVATIISFYGNVLKLDDAVAVFEDIEDDEKTVVTVNAMMSSFVANERGEDALDLYGQYLEGAIKLNDISHVLALKACLETANLEKTLEIHYHLEGLDHDRWKRNSSMMVNLITLYGKMGRLDVCDQLFAECLENRGREYAQFETLNINEVYNAMIDAHGNGGDIEMAMTLCSEMESPSISTFIILLKCCSRCGDVDTGQRIWSELIQRKEDRFNAHIVNTLVDCLARSGFLNLAFERIIDFERYHEDEEEAYPNLNNRHLMWTALLGACAKFNDALFAQFVFDEFSRRFDTEVVESAPVLLSNVYGAHSHFDKRKAVREEAETTFH